MMGADWVGLVMRVNLMAVIALIVLSTQAFGYIDEYNNYNTNVANNSPTNMPNTPNNGTSNTPQGLQAALGIFQNVDCQHMGCQTKNQDFWDQSGNKSATPNFKITPSNSADSSDSSNDASQTGDEMPSALESGSGADLVGS